MRIGFLGLGEAGRVLAEGFAKNGHEVSGFDPAAVTVADTVRQVGSEAEAVAAADIVFSLVTARHAVSVAQRIAPHLDANTLVIDLNSGSSELKREVAKAIDAVARASQSVVDGAIIGSVLQFAEKVSILLAGPKAEEAAALIEEAGGNPTVVATEVGVASDRKLLRSVFLKGLGALVSEAMDAGDTTGETQWMRDQIEAELSGGAATLDRLRNGTRIHGNRRSAELGDSLNLLEGFSSSWPVTRAAQDYHSLVAQDDNLQEIFEALKEIPTAAIGDGSDRLGFADSSVKPVWNAPRLVGRAITVQAHAGDNLGVHAAIKAARPGDVIVVSGQGFTDRAMMGMLVANRCINRGIIGFITDGAIRDRDELEELEFPVWAAGESPAGPYKHGPYRLHEDIAIGGAVCHTGDFVVADNDGVCFIPPHKIYAAIAGGRAVLADEQQRLEKILAERGSE